MLVFMMLLLLLLLLLMMITRRPKESPSRTSELSTPSGVTWDRGEPLRVTPSIHRGDTQPKINYFVAEFRKNTG